MTAEAVASIKCDGCNNRRFFLQSDAEQGRAVLTQEGWGHRGDNEDYCIVCRPRYMPQTQAAT